MSRKQYRVGIVGCGGVGRDHANAYESHGRTELVAAVDTDAEALESFADRFDVDATYAEYGEMLAGESVDVVSVCTWHDTHAEMTIDAAEAGVDGIVCEKPMATSLGEAEDMLAAAERNGAKLTVSHQLRYDPVHARARDLIAEGVIGEPRVATAASDGGLINTGTHAIDLSRYLLGDPDHEWVIGQIQRKTDRHERGEPIEDRCLGQVCFEDGTRLTYEGDLPGEGSKGSLQVYGSDGLLSVERGSKVDVITDDGTFTYAPEAERNARHAYVDDLLDWMAGDRRSHRCSGKQARHTVEIQMSIYESVRTRGLVRAPLRTRANPLAAMLRNGELPVEHPGKYDIRLPYAGVRDDG